MPRLRPDQKTIHIIVDLDENNKFRMAAAKAGVNLSEWVRQVCHTAAGRSLLNVMNGPPTTAIEQRLEDVENELHDLKKKLASAFPVFLQLGEGYDHPEK